MGSSNFTDKAVSNLHTDRDPPVGNSAGDDGRGRLHTKISNKADEPVPVMFTNGGGVLTTEKTAVTISAGQINTWVAVPLIAINNVVTIETFDDLDLNRIIMQWRINMGTIVQVNSPTPLTFTVHTIGYIS